LIYYENEPKLDTDSLVSALKSSVESPIEYANEVQQNLEESKYQDVVNSIVNGISDDDTLELTLNIDKSNILLEENFDCEFNSSMEVQFWINENTLRRWVDSITVEKVIREQFTSDSIPYHVFLEYDHKMSDHLGLFSKESLLDGYTVTSATCNKNNKNTNDVMVDLFSDIDSEIPPISPLLFDENNLREIYSGCFLTFSMQYLSDECDINNNNLSVKTITDRHHISKEYDLEADSSLSSSDEDLSAIYSIIENIHNKESLISLSHWRHAVATQCSSFDDVSSNVDKITHYAGFLQEESAKEELEQLQSTVQQVSELTRTIANSVSETAQKLSSDLQNIVIALLAAIVTNFVLILRYSDFYVLAPFSVASISGILIFYFPAVQNRIDNAQEIMENRTNDFILYFSEIRANVGNSVFELDKIIEQHESHLETAAQTIAKAQVTIGKVYILLIFLWFTVIFYGHLVVDGISDSSIFFFLSNFGVQTSVSAGSDLISLTVILSIFPAGWILLRSGLSLYSGSALCQKGTSSESININLPKSDKTNEKKTVDELFSGDVKPDSYVTYYSILSVLLLILIVMVSVFRVIASI
jgi:hypothetical protein